VQTLVQNAKYVPYFGLLVLKIFKTWVFNRTKKILCYHHVLILCINAHYSWPSNKWQVLVRCLASCVLWKLITWQFGSYACCGSYACLPPNWYVWNYIEDQTARLCYSIHPTEQQVFKLWWFL